MTKRLADLNREVAAYWIWSNSKGAWRTTNATRYTRLLHEAAIFRPDEATRILNLNKANRGNLDHHDEVAIPAQQRIA